VFLERSYQDKSNYTRFQVWIDAHQIFYYFVQKFPCFNWQLPFTHRGHRMSSVGVSVGRCSMFKRHSLPWGTLMGACKQTYMSRSPQVCTQRAQCLTNGCGCHLSRPSLVYLISTYLSLSPTPSPTPSPTLSLRLSLSLSEPFTFSLLPVATYPPRSWSREQERERARWRETDIIRERELLSLVRLRGCATEIHAGTYFDQYLTCTVRYQTLCSSTKLGPTVRPRLSVGVSAVGGGRRRRHSRYISR